MPDKPPGQVEGLLVELPRMGGGTCPNVPERDPSGRSLRDALPPFHRPKVRQEWRLVVRRVREKK